MFKVRGVKLVGLAATCGAIDVIAIGLAAGAPRPGATRGAPFCTVGFNPWPETPWTVTESAATKQIAENRVCFINCSAN